MSTPWIVAHLALWVAVVVTLVTVLGVLRGVSAVLAETEARLAAFTAHARVGGAPPGTKVASFAVRDEEGRPVASGELLAEPAVFVFMESFCEPCLALADRLAEAGEVESTPPVLLILDDSPAGRRFPVPRGARALYQSNRAASEAFQNVSTPQAFAVSSATVVDLVVPGSAEDLRRLAARLHGGGDGQTGDRRPLTTSPTR